MNKSLARLALEKDREVILQLFHNRCVICGCPSQEIHEILPISRGKVALVLENRVVICRKHHDWAHAVGTNISIPILQQKREDYLIRCQSISEQQHNKEFMGEWDVENLQKSS